MATSDIRQTQQPATAPSNRPHSKMSRIEALKATAASLSNRIESEARKLVGEGINYGTATTMDVDSVLASGRSKAHLDDSCWAEMAATENNDMPFRIQKILTSTGHSSYSGTALPGVSNLYSFNGQEINNGTHVNLNNTQTPHETEPILNSYSQERRKIVNDLQKMDKMTPKREYDKEVNPTERHDSSAGSISEGPIMSDGSFSEDDASLPHAFVNHVAKAADRLEGTGYCAGQRTDCGLSEFQNEAAKCSAFAPLQDNKITAWEELNKGSPLSVINIFARNLHGHVTG